MNLTKEKLKVLWEKKYFNKENDVTKRFVEINDIVDAFCELEIKDSYLKAFAPLSDGLLGDNGDGNRQTMIKDEVPNVDRMWKLVGGFNGSKVEAKYRIISSSLGKKENYYENSNYSTYHRSLWANSNFVTNNYPDQIAKFLQLAQNNKSFDDCLNESKIVLTWKTDNYLEKKEDDYFTASKNRLKTRFPLKFLWMWANKDKVIHPLSLMAFRNFLDSEFGKDILKVDNKYTPESVTNMPFDDFTKFWGIISDKILEILEIDKHDKNIQNLSKLISQICIEETDIKNISDILTTGNKAVILWGPPGTGKTYESESVVKEILGVSEDENFEKKYLFSKGHLNRNQKGYYEIIQFHPNYTYQDFIGGISPNLDKNDVSYELREGVFKKFCDTAKRKSNQKFIFIIDEINRAELSAVFGELLYALEYRGKSIYLPYFGEFTIPENVYILGTMNNVDKSLVTFDLALRRRFGFFKLMPKLDVINDVLGEVVEEKSLRTYFEKCEALNKSIETELDLGKDYQIGQAYFLKIKDFLDSKKIEIGEQQIITSFELEKLWVYNLEPLLEEYLGMSIEDENINDKLKKLKEKFLKDN